MQKKKLTAGHGKFNMNIMSTKYFFIATYIILTSCSQVGHKLQNQNEKRSPSNASDFPLQMNCSEDSNRLTISAKSEKWYVWNSNHFVNSKGKTVISPVEVTISSTALQGQFLISAVDEDLLIATASPKNNGDIPFTNLLITLSIDYLSSPAKAQLSHNGNLATYACCENKMIPPERGIGFCKQ